MSVHQLPLRKVLQLFYAERKLRDKILREDIRAEIRKEAGGSKSNGGDFYTPFWADVKTHISEGADLHYLIEKRIEANTKRARLYPLLRDGIYTLLNDKLRWYNEPVEIVSKNVSGTYVVPGTGCKVVAKDAIFARVRGEYDRIVYPYFSEVPELSDEAARLGLWLMSQCLPNLSGADMRIIDVLRYSFYSPNNTPLVGNEYNLFVQKYRSTESRWNELYAEILA